MNICLIGNGLTNLILAKILLKKKIKVDICCFKKKEKEESIRTIGLSNTNLNYLNKFIPEVNKKVWNISQIKIFNERNQREELLNFNSNKLNTFSVIKNDEIYKIIEKSLNKEKNLKKKYIKNNIFYSNLNLNKYDLVINSLLDNKISNKYFYKRINKNYSSIAYATIIKHKKTKNETAYQTFTKFGPIAFLPISENETSIVFSINKKNFFGKKNSIYELIKKYNKKYKILFFNKVEKFELKFSLLKKYYYNNILAFGDCLHKIHPLAGQGFNMNIRDIKILSDLIDENLELGLPLNSILLKKFENKSKHMNFLFASGIDLIHEFFRIENKMEKNYSKKIFKYLKTNNIFNKYANKFADEGFIN